jgi:hypothetical protein
MNEKTLEMINGMAGVKTASVDAVSAGLINDLIKGASQNPRLKNVELGGALAGAGFSAIDVAKTAGALLALEEAGYGVKEASEAMSLDEDTLQAVAAYWVG